MLFPHAVVPLHVFEQRYRALVRDALRADRLIAIALLKPGWEQDYHGSPDFFGLGCLARMDRVEWRPDDCFDLWVCGISRVRFQRMTTEYPYRAVTVSLVPQEPLPDDDPLVKLERQALEEAYRRVAGAMTLISPATVGGPAKTSRAHLSFEAYLNSVCAEVALDPAEKLGLLELDSLLERSRRLREWMERSLRDTGEPGREGERN